MNKKEIEIADKILQSISSQGADHRQESIFDYLNFMKAVQIRVQTEAQVIENKVQNAKCNHP